MKKFLSGILCLFMFATYSYAYAPNDFLAEMDEPGLCALTFDDGPSRFTGHLLDMMAAENVKATFFVLGENVLSFPDIIKRQRKEGHEVANHSWSHPNLGRASAAAIRSQLAMTNAALAQLGVTPKFFRPPYGSYTPYVVEAANAQGMEIAIWTHDSRDWKRLPRSYAALVPCQTAEKRHGVFLFHDIHERTVNDFPRIVRELRASGCRRFVTLSEYMKHMKKPEAIPTPQLYVCHKRALLHAAHSANTIAAPQPVGDVFSRKAKEASNFDVLHAHRNTEDTENTDTQN